MPTTCANGQPQELPGKGKTMSDHSTRPARSRFAAFIAALAVLIAAPLAVVAADGFTDVPDSNVFHDNITWLADAGVTKGCNPPANTEFCPSDNVTREQMAAFMQRLADNQVVDAGALEGNASSDFVMQGEANSVTPVMTAAEAGVAQVNDAGFYGLDGTVQDIDSITITAPAAGFVIVSLTSEVWSIHVSGVSRTETQVGVSTSSTSFASGEDHDIQIPSAAASGTYVDTVGVTKVFPVSAGANTFYFLAERATGTGGQVGDYQMTAMFVGSSYGTVDLASAGEGNGDGE